MKKLIKVKKVIDLEGGHLGVSTLIVNTILSNLDTEKKYVYALSILVEEDTEEENGEYDVTVNKEHFIMTLQDNLLIQERFEQYEKCAEIRNALKYLTKNLEKHK